MEICPAVNDNMSYGKSVQWIMIICRIVNQPVEIYVSIRFIKTNSSHEFEKIYEYILTIHFIYDKYRLYL